MMYSLSSSVSSVVLPTAVQLGQELKQVSTSDLDRQEVSRTKEPSSSSRVHHRKAQ